MARKTKKVKVVKVTDKTKLPFDKFDFYFQSVQSPEGDVRFYQRAYRELLKSSACKTLREDFCAAGAISAEWVKLDKSYRSCGVDLDPIPLDYGRKAYLGKLKPDQKSRVMLIEKDVLEGSLPQADIVAAVNFSYFFFKKRETLKHYFQNVYNSISKKGLFIVDIFGGSQCQTVIEDKHKVSGFTYYWDQQSFDPVSYEALFQIHFKYNGVKYENVFTYDWRMWTIPEIREIMEEVGFAETKIYWEGSNSKGGGNGIFKIVEEGEADQSWIAYVAGIKR